MDYETALTTFMVLAVLGFVFILVRLVLPLGKNEEENSEDEDGYEGMLIEVLDHHADTLSNSEDRVANDDFLETAKND